MSQHRIRMVAVKDSGPCSWWVARSQPSSSPRWPGAPAALPIRTDRCVWSTLLLGGGVEYPLAECRPVGGDRSLRCAEVHLFRADEFAATGRSTRPEAPSRQGMGDRPKPVPHACVSGGRRGRRRRGHGRGRRAGAPRAPRAAARSSPARSAPRAGRALPFSCLATSLRPIRPRSLSTSCTITSSTSPRDITSSMCADAARADVRDVEQSVGALLQLDEGAELRRLDDLAGVGVADLGLLRQGVDRGDRGRRPWCPRSRRRGSSRPPRCRSGRRGRPRARGSSRRPCR